MKARGLGNGQSFVAALQQTGLSMLAQAGSKIIFKSNLTPEIIIDVSTLAGKQVSPDHPDVSSRSRATLGLIQPKVTLKALGLHTSRAPYGNPNPNAWMFILAAFIGAGLVGMKLAWSGCKKIGSKKYQTKSLTETSS